MQRVNPVPLFGLALLAGLFAMMLVIFFLSFGSHGAPTAQAIVPTNTPTPGATPTPKPSGTTPVGGLLDMAVGPGLYKCMVWLDANPANNQLKASAQCYTLAPIGFDGSEPPCDAVHTNGGGATPVVPGEGNCEGHNGEPPYSPLAPFKLIGTYDPSGTGTVTVTGCFEDIGTNYGPNAIGQLTYTGATAFQAASAGSSTPGTALFWLNQDNAACTAAETTQTVPLVGQASLPITITKPAAGNGRDLDGDGCSDRDELLAEKGSTAKCGDDPFNPLDPVGPSPDVSGSYDIRARAVRNNTAGGAVFNPAQAGFYYECKADIQQTTKNLTARIVCYIDSPTVTVNPQVAAGSANSGVNNCPPANVKYCGDGMPAPAPPGCSVAAKGGSCATLANQGTGCPTLPCDVSQYQFADIDDRQTVLTGTLDNTSNDMDLQGCFEDRDGHAAEGNVYWRAKIDAHTGVGIAQIFKSETTANCTAGTPANAPVVAQVSAVRQAPGPKSAATATFPFGCVKVAGLYTNCRDSDGDGCPDKMELQDNKSQGGLRDPLNRWDFFGPATPGRPHVQTVADIIAAIHQFNKNQGNAAYTIDTDRTALIGGANWNLGPPDGQQTVADILAAIKQFNQGC